MRLERLKRFIADIIEPTKKANALSIIYNVLMSLIVITSCAFVFVDIFTPDGSYWSRIAFNVEIVALCTFAFEYLLKLFVSEVLYEGKGWWKSKLLYITSFDSFVDIICFLSILLNRIPKEFAALRLLKLVKLARLVKLKDAVDEIREQGDGTEEKKEKKKGFRYRIYQIIAKDEQGDALSKAYDIVSLIIIILSVVTVALDTFTFPEDVEKGIFISEVVFTVFFAIEYVLRVWTADYEYPEVDKEHAKMKYIFSFLAIVDLLSILPIFFTFSPDAESSLPNAVAVLKIFKIFRIARLLKMSRYLYGINLFASAIKAKAKQIFFSIIVLISMVILCSILLYSFENAAGNDIFVHGFSGIFFAISTLTGFGQSDVEIVSIGGKVMVVIMIISGGCIVGVPLGIIGEEFAKMVAKSSRQSDNIKFDEAFNKVVEELTIEEKMEIMANHKEKYKQIEEEEND